MSSKSVTEMCVGSITYVVTSECSPTATESLEKKLERLILRHVSDMKSYPFCIKSPLAMREYKSEYDTCH